MWRRLLKSKGLFKLLPPQISGFQYVCPIDRRAYWLLSHLEPTWTINIYFSGVPIARYALSFRNDARQYFGHSGLVLPIPVLSNFEFSIDASVHSRLRQLPQTHFASQKPNRSDFKKRWQPTSFEHAVASYNVKGVIFYKSTENRLKLLHFKTI